MRKAISILAGCLLTAAVFAGGDNPDMIKLVVTPQTNATAVAAGQASRANLWNWIDTVIVDIGGGGGVPTNTITLTTTASLGTGPARTLLTLTDQDADGVYPVRDLAVDQTGSDIASTPARIPLVADTLVLSAYGANTTTNTLTVYIIFDSDN